MKRGKNKQGMFLVSGICFLSFLSFYIHLEAMITRMGIEFRSWTVIGGKIIFWGLFIWLAVSAGRYGREHSAKSRDKKMVYIWLLLVVFLQGAGAFHGLTTSSLFGMVDKEYKENGFLIVKAAGESETEKYLPLMGVFRISAARLEMLKNEDSNSAESADKPSDSDDKDDVANEQQEPENHENDEDTENQENAESPEMSQNPSENREIYGEGDYEFERQVEAAKLIYDKCLKEKGYTYAEGVSARGEWYIDVGDGKRLVFDRMSKNGKCYLFALNTADYSALEDYYAVNLDTKEVIATGKHNYAQSGGEAYYKATGEY